MIARSLRVRYVKAAAPLCVTIMQPLPGGTYQLVFGRILGEMHRGDELHHYRVSLGDGIVLLAPPEWLHPASHLAVKQAGLTVPNHLAASAAIDCPLPETY